MAEPRGKKPKVLRRRASNIQVEALQKVYAENNTPDPQQMIALSETLELAVDWLYGWFYRQKIKDGNGANRQKRSRGRKKHAVKSGKAGASPSMADARAAEGRAPETKHMEKRRAKAKKKAAPVTQPRNSPAQSSVAQKKECPSPSKRSESSLLPDASPLHPKALPSAHPSAATGDCQDAVSFASESEPSSISNPSAHPSNSTSPPAPPDQCSHPHIHPDSETDAGSSPQSPSTSEGDRTFMNVAPAPYLPFLAIEPLTVPLSFGNFIAGEMPFEAFERSPPYLSSNAALFPLDPPMHYLGHENMPHSLVYGWLEVEGCRPLEGIHF
ncbi:hypothetical protein NLJ89_g6869 [Agrocybe chaxingu]|uniref:Homeobox domain-containing protein n=1 Tax=Agrocybe chaxingu TaxID=84603 RepID=A0A9W8MVZ7_9AGAR|nr:hypothetical protein NLJ89_g6869 [Agrocybe chaxingu]